jgi:hypothetical protein
LFGPAVGVVDTVLQLQLGLVRRTWASVVGILAGLLVASPLLGGAAEVTLLPPDAAGVVVVFGLLLGGCAAGALVGARWCVFAGAVLLGAWALEAAVLVVGSAAAPATLPVVYGGLAAVGIVLSARSDR